VPKFLLVQYYGGTHWTARYPARTNDVIVTHLVLLGQLVVLGHDALQVLLGMLKDVRLVCLAVADARYAALRTERY
jgi:hypothetical protein